MLDDDNNYKNPKIEELANNILKVSKNSLLVNLRFLDLALGQFNNSSAINYDVDTYATDGISLIYNPLHILKSYKLEKEIVPREYMHIIMHCIFRHMFISPSIKRTYWNLACDIAIENSITELDISQITTLKSEKQQAVIEDLKKKSRHMTAECIYCYFLDNLNIYTEDKIKELSDLFYADCHDFWYKQGGLDQNPTSSGTDGKNKDHKKQGNGQSQEKGQGDNQRNGQGNDQGQGDNKRNGQGNGSDNTSNNSIKQVENQLNQRRKEMEETWKDISERIQVDMETFSSNHGHNSDSLIQNLKEINREKYDYSLFLKKFATINEVMKINDDEFDYIFYTYGLSLYDNMPLIEPLEYKDEKRVKEFVIAIDTSGSVEGELVQRFVEKTYNILKSTESFTSKVNIHIIQCDAELQEDKKITNQNEFDEYIKTMKLHGFGGTDFRPVFSYVNQLIMKKEFINLKGLIYFTDGFGDFPEQKTPYSTAFVFMDDNYNNYEVPSWAMKLILEPNDIMNNKN